MATNPSLYSPNDPAIIAALEQMRLEKAAQGERLVRCAEMLMHHALVLQGVEEDHTGVGSWRIFCQNFEIIMGVKVVPFDWHVTHPSPPT